MCRRKIKILRGINQGAGFVRDINDERGATFQIESRNRGRGMSKFEHGVGLSQSAVKAQSQEL